MSHKSEPHPRAGELRFLRGGRPEPAHELVRDAALHHTGARLDRAPDIRCHGVARPGAGSHPEHAGPRRFAARSTLPVMTVVSQYEREWFSYKKIHRCFWTMKSVEGHQIHSWRIPP